MTWRYDGSFEGFLSAVAQSYLRRQIPDLFAVETVPNLLEPPVTILTDDRDAEKVMQALRRTLDPAVVRRVLHAFLCDDAPRERELLLFIRMGLKEARLVHDPVHPVVRAVETYERRVLTTLHRLHAFARFEILADGMLYARIDPPRNVLPLMGRHFVKRFGRERFIIHDTIRQTALVYDTRTLELHTVHDYEIPERSRDEARFQALWKRFFDTVAIEVRRNPKLQRQWVPLHYRSYMTEFQE